MLRLASLTDLSGLRLPRRPSYSEAKNLQFYGSDWYTGRRRGKGAPPRETSPWGRFGYLGLRRRRRRSGSDVSLAGYWIVRICLIRILRAVTAGRRRLVPRRRVRSRKTRLGASWALLAHSGGANRGGPLESMGPGVDQSKSCTS
jgi:hypothetical protein